MQTGDLIDTLSSKAGKPDGPSLLTGLLLCVLAAAVYGVISIVILAGVRADVGAAGGWVLAKAGLSLGFAAIAAPLAISVSRPGGSGGVWRAALAMLFGLAFIAALVATLSAAPGARVDALTGGGYPHILTVVPLLAVPIGALLFVWMRRQAPTRPAVAGACLGVLAGALSAAAYALTCPVDVMAFVVAAYSLAIVLCGVIGAILGQYLLRW